MSNKKFENVKLHVDWDDTQYSDKRSSDVQLIDPNENMAKTLEKLQHSQLNAIRVFSCTSYTNEENLWILDCVPYDGNGYMQANTQDYLGYTTIKIKFNNPDETESGISYANNYGFMIPIIRLHFHDLRTDTDVTSDFIFGGGYVTGRESSWSFKFESFNHYLYYGRCVMLCNLMNYSPNVVRKTIESQELYYTGLVRKGYYTSGSWSATMTSSNYLRTIRISLKNQVKLQILFTSKSNATLDIQIKPENSFNCTDRTVTDGNLITLKTTSYTTSTDCTVIAYYNSGVSLFDDDDIMYSIKIVQDMDVNGYIALDPMYNYSNINRVFFGTCNTSSENLHKYVTTLRGFTLKPGVILYVTFANGHAYNLDSDLLLLSVNSTGLIPIKHRSYVDPVTSETIYTQLPSYKWLSPDKPLGLIFDGTCWIVYTATGSASDVTSTYINYNDTAPTEVSDQLYPLQLTPEPSITSSMNKYGRPKHTNDFYINPYNRTLYGLNFYLSRISTYTSATVSNASGTAKISSFDVSADNLMTKFSSAYFVLRIYNDPAATSTITCMLQCIVPLCYMNAHQTYSGTYDCGVDVKTENKVLLQLKYKNATTFTVTLSGTSGIVVGGAARYILWPF